MADIPEQDTAGPPASESHAEKRENEAPAIVQPTTTESDIKPAIRNARTSERKKKCWLEWGKFTVEVLTLIVVAIYTGIAFRQWREMRNAVVEATKQSKAAGDSVKAAQDSLNLSKEQFQMDQRPYISVESFGLLQNTQPYPPQIGKPIEVNIRWKNVGKSPAFHIVVHRHILFGARASNDWFRVEPPDDPEKMPGSILMAGDPGWVTSYSLRDTWRNELSFTAQDLVPWTGEQPIIVFGRITYTDVYGNKYCTDFGRVAPPELGGWLVIDMYKTICPPGYRP